MFQHIELIEFKSEGEIQKNNPKRLCGNFGVPSFYGENNADHKKNPMQRIALSHRFLRPKGRIMPSRAGRKSTGILGADSMGTAWEIGKMREMEEIRLTTWDVWNVCK